MDLKETIAHVAEDRRVHGLEEPLRGTAERAAGVAGGFGGAVWYKMKRGMS